MNDQCTWKCNKYPSKKKDNWREGRWKFVEYLGWINNQLNKLFKSKLYLYSGKESSIRGG